MSKRHAVVQKILLRFEMTEEQCEIVMDAAVILSFTDGRVHFRCLFVFSSKGRPALLTLMSASPSRVRMEGSAWTLLTASFVVACQVIQVMLGDEGGWNRVLLVNC